MRMDVVVTFTRVLSGEQWGWRPYCGGLNSELEARKETKTGLLSLGAHLRREGTSGEGQDQGGVLIGDAGPVL